MGQAAIELPRWLVDQAKSRRVVVMAGAGVSAGPPSALPGWHQLNRMIVAALGERVDGYLGRAGYTADVCAAIDARRTAGAFPPDYQAQILEENSGEYYFRALQCLDGTTRNAAHEAIAHLAAQGVLAAIVTTNFDWLIEQALSARGVAFEVAYEPETYARCLRGLTAAAGGPLQVVKVHGCVRALRSMVDTLKQRLLGRNEQLERVLAHLLAGHPWVFLGFSAEDLETDDGYLGLIPASKSSLGIAYVQWPGEPTLSVGAGKLLDAYGGKAERVVADSAPFLGVLGRALSVPDVSAAPTTGAADPSAQLASKLREWARGLTPAAAVNCLATVAEVAGLAHGAFELLHRFWKDVFPGDREGPDFERYRFHHGRLGIGGGILSAVDDLRTDRGFESLQNLLRVKESDPRATAWAAVAFAWAGNAGQALPLLLEAERAFEPAIAAEVRADVWLAVSEALFGLVQPEGLFETWPATANAVRKAGDLAREAKVIAMMALFFAEFVPNEYLAFLQRHAEPVFARAKRLNDPAIAGFAHLAHGRYLTKTQAGALALETLQRATEHLEAAGRPPWRLFAAIEYAKALLDLGSVERAHEAADLLGELKERVDRYQLWLPWYYEAVGQHHLCFRKPVEARAAFEQAIRCADQIGISRKADALRSYLVLCGGPAGQPPPA